MTACTLRVRAIAGDRFPRRSDIAGELIGEAAELPVVVEIGHCAKHDDQRMYKRLRHVARLIVVGGRADGVDDFVHQRFHMRR
jgi:hypothetical protein